VELVAVFLQSVYSWTPARQQHHPLCFQFDLIKAGTVSDREGCTKMQQGESAQGAVSSQPDGGQVDVEHTHDRCHRVGYRQRCSKCAQCRRRATWLDKDTLSCSPRSRITNLRFYNQTSFDFVKKVSNSKYKKHLILVASGNESPYLQQMILTICTSTANLWEICLCTCIQGFTAGLESQS
jgi:hypothetical protein